MFHFLLTKCVKDLDPRKHLYEMKNIEVMNLGSSSNLIPVKTRQYLFTKVDKMFETNYFS